MVTVTRELTADDYRAFNTFVIRSARGARPVAAGLMIMALLVTAFAVFEVAGWKWDLATSAATFVVLAAWVVLVLLVFGPVVTPAPDGVFSEPRELTVTDEGLFDRGARFEFVYRWPAIQQVAVTDDHVFIMADRMLGLIVPRDCFADDAEEAFLRAVRRRCPESAELTGFERVEGLTP